MLNRGIKRISLLNMFHVSILSILILSVSIFFTYPMKTKLFYLNWVAGFIVVLSFMVFKKLKYDDLKMFVLFTLWLWWEIAVTPFVLDVNLHLKYVSITLFYVVVAIMLFRFIFDSDRRYLSVFYLLSVLWLIANSGALILYITGYPLYEGSFSGICYNRNQFAIITLLFMSILLFKKEHYSQLTRQTVNFMVVVFGSLIIVSMSVKGFIGLFILLFMYSYSKKRFTGKMKSVLLTALVIIAILYIDNPLSKRIDKYFHLIRNLSVYEPGYGHFTRLYLIVRSLDIAYDNLYVGIGVNNSRKVLPTSGNAAKLITGNTREMIATDEGTYSHNNYVEMLLNGGIPAFVLFYLPIFWILFRLLMKKQKCSDTYFPLTLIIIRLFLDVGMVSYFDFSVIFMTVIAMGLYFKEKREGRNENHLHRVNAQKMRPNQPIT